MTSHGELVARLRGAGKSNRGAAGWSRWVNRPAGRHLAALAYRVGMRPNQVSALSGLITAAGLVVVAVTAGSVAGAVAGALLLLLGYAVDSADGQLARLQGSSSLAGEWLDHVLDAAKVVAVHLVLAVAWWRAYHPSPAWMLVPFGFAVVASTFFAAVVLADLLRRVDRAGRGESRVGTASLNPSEPAPVLRSVLVLPADYGVLCLAVALLPVEAAFVGVYVVLFIANVGFTLAACARWLRELGRLT